MAGPPNPSPTGRCALYVLAGTAAGLDDRAVRARLDALALPVCAPDAVPRSGLVLAAGPAGLELRPGDAIHRSGVSVTLPGLHPRARPTRREPLARAVGPGRRRVVDATAGLGADAFRLAALGHDVIAVERVAPIALLLHDGLARARRDARHRALAARIELHAADARTLLPQLAPAADVVVLDPMYPPKRSRSALPPLAVQLLRRLVGDDSDADALFDVARRFAGERVVVKRPRKAPPLAPDPQVQYEGKLVRYDVYIRAK